jgi:hypothetical protein
MFSRVVVVCWATSMIRSGHALAEALFDKACDPGESVKLAMNVQSTDLPITIERDQQREASADAG